MYLNDYVLSTDDSDENLTYREALMSSHKSDWNEATRKSYNALIENNTWLLSPLRSCRKAIGSRWAIKIERHDDGSIEKFKARFVEVYKEQPGGFAQAGANGETLYWKLQNCLYGLKQAGMEWIKPLTQLFLKNEFVQSAEDHCLFRCDEINGSQFFVLVWVLFKQRQNAA